MCTRMSRWQTFCWALEEAREGLFALLEQGIQTSLWDKTNILFLSDLLGFTRIPVSQQNPLASRTSSDIDAIIDEDSFHRKSTQDRSSDRSIDRTTFECRVQPFFSNMSRRTVVATQQHGHRFLSRISMGPGEGQGGCVN